MSVEFSVVQHCAKYNTGVYGEWSQPTASEATASEWSQWTLEEGDLDAGPLAAIPRTKHAIGTSLVDFKVTEAKAQGFSDGTQERQQQDAFGEKGKDVPVITFFMDTLRKLIEAERDHQRQADLRWAELEAVGSRLEMELIVAGLLDPKETLNSWKQMKRTQDTVKEPRQSLSSHGSVRVSNVSQDRQSMVTFQESDGTTPQRTSSGKEKMRRSCTDIMLEEEKAILDSIRKVEQERWWFKAVQSYYFDVAVGCLIVMSTVVMALHLQYTGVLIKQEMDTGCSKSECDLYWPAAEAVFTVLEHVFTTLFVAELSIRIAVSGLAYFKYASNSIDAVIVFASAADSWFLVHFEAVLNADINVLRLARLIRLAKVFRVVRVMKAFESLHVLISAIARSIGALGWSMVLLFVLELVGAMLLSSLIQPTIQEQDMAQEVRVLLWDRFGTWSKAMYTFFEMTMAPGGFLQYRELGENLTPMFTGIIIAYQVLVTFAVIRIITAMFLKATLGASDKEEEHRAKTVARQRRMYAELLIQQVDHDCSGALDWDELTDLMTFPKMKLWMDEIGLTMPEVKRLFLSLDRGDGEIEFAEFVHALLRMSGPPRASDAVVMLHESRAILTRITEVEKALGIVMFEGNAPDKNDKFEHEMLGDVKQQFLEEEEECQR